MDGLYYLSEQREINESSRRSFNQQQVLMECILAELRRAGPQLYEEYKKKSAVKESNELVLEGLQQPWDNIAALKRLFMSDPTTKSKEKFFGIIDCLTDHPVLRQFNLNVEAVFYDVICKVIFNYPHLKGPSCLTIKRKQPIIKQPFQSPIASPMTSPISSPLSIILDAGFFGDLGPSDLESQPWEFLEEVMSGEFDTTVEARPQHPAPVSLEESPLFCEPSEDHSPLHGFCHFKSLTDEQQLATNCSNGASHSPILYSNTVLLRPVATCAVRAPPPPPSYPAPERPRFLPPPIITALPSPPKLQPISPFSPAHRNQQPMSPIDSSPFPAVESAFHARRAYFFGCPTSLPSSTDAVVYKAVTPCARDRKTQSIATTTGIKMEAQEKESADDGELELVLDTSCLGLEDDSEESALPRVSPMLMPLAQHSAEEVPDAQSDFDWDCFEVFCDDDTFLCQDSSLSVDNACTLGGTGREWSTEIGTPYQASCVTTAAECGRKRKLNAQNWESVNLALSTAT